MEVFRLCRLLFVLTKLSRIPFNVTVGNQTNICTWLPSVPSLKLSQIAEAHDSDNLRSPFEPEGSTTTILTFTNRLIIVGRLFLTFTRYVAGEIEKASVLRTSQVSLSHVSTINSDQACMHETTHAHKNL